LVEGGESTVSLTTPNAHFFVELSDVVIQQREGGVPNSMLQMMDSFQVPLSTSTVEAGNSPQVKHTGSYYEFSKSMRLRKNIAVNSETSFVDDLTQEVDHGPNVSGSQVRLTECKQKP
jgi:hypothetical protein